VTTTLGDTPRLISGGGGGAGAAPARPTRKVAGYSWYDDGADVVVLVSFDAAALAGAAVAARAADGSAALRVSFADHDALLELRGLAGAVASAEAKKGKARVTLRLRKAPPADGGEPAAWAALLKGGGGAAAPDFGDFGGGEFGGAGAGDEE